MNRQFYFGLIFLLLGLLMAYPLRADDTRVIYLYGTLSDYCAPIEGNEAAYENARLFETSPGSRIYEGVITRPGSFGISVGLHTALAPVEAGPDAAFYNIIAPADDTPSELRTQDSSGIITATVKNEEKYTRYLPLMNFYIPTDDWAKSYRFNLNLNNNRLTIIPDYAIVALVNDESVPTLETADRYESIKYGKKRYMDRGVLKFRFYDYFNQAWIGAPEGSSTMNAVDGMNKINGQQGSDRFFTVNDWHGGTMEFDGTGLDNIGFNVLKNIAYDALYAVGPFNFWDSRNPLQGNKDQGSDDCVFIFDLPVTAGKNELKLLTEKSWEGVTLGSDGFMWRDANGYLSLGIDKNQYGISFTTDKPTGSTLKLKVNLTTRELTFMDKNAVISVQDCSLKGNSLFVSFASDCYEPWLGAPYTITNGIQKLYEMSPGVYSGNIYVAKGDFNFNFISGLSPKSSHNSTIGPSARDREVIFGDYVHHSSATEFSDGSAGRWTLARWGGGAINATVDKNSNPVRVTFSTVPELANGEMFMVGMPNNWPMPVEENREFLESWRLQPTTKGFYGSFDIAAGEAMFRFYNGLDGWDVGSIGCQPDDVPIEYSLASGDFEGESVRGKGSWSFPDWPGGKMYMFVSEYSMKVHFSNRPISGVGYPFEEAGTETGVYAYSDGRYSWFNEDEPGVYSGAVKSGCELRLFTRISGYSTDEREWAGSYAISAPSTDYSVEYDELGVAESDYFTKNGINTDGAHPFYLPDIFDANSVYVMVTVDTNKNKIYFDNMSTVYLVGTLTDGEIPTYATRAKYRKAALDKWHKTGIIEAPAGDFTFYYYELGRRELEPAVREITFDGAFAKGSDINYGFTRAKCVIRNWKGGKLLMTPLYIMNLDQLHSIKAWSGEASQTLQETSAGSHIYKGDMTLKSSADKTVSFKLHEGLDWRDNLSIGSCAMTMRDASFQYVYACHKDRIKYFSAGTVKSKGAVGGEAFYLPELKDDNVKATLTVDLNDLSVEISVNESALGKTYTLLMGDGTSEYIVEPSAADASKSVVSIYLNGGDHSFNIIGNDEEVIIPADGDTSVVFDRYGIWEGDYLTVSLPSDTKAHKAAPAMGKWNVTMSEFGNLYIQIDRTSKKIKISYPLASKSYYTVMADVNGGEILGDYPTIDNMEPLKSGMLTSIDGVVYSGFLSVDENSTSSSFYLFAGIPMDIYHKISTVISYRFPTDVVDLSESSATILTELPDFNCNPWVVSYPKGVKQIKLDYDAYLHQLSLSCSNSGVEDVLASGDCDITALEGCVRVSADSDMRLTIYSLQGFVVKDVAIHAGITYIELPSGLYIANGQKLWVR